MVPSLKTKNNGFLSRDSPILSFEALILSRPSSNGAGLRAPPSPFFFRDVPRLKQKPDALWICGQSAFDRPGLSGHGPAYGRPVDGQAAHRPPTARPTPRPSAHKLHRASLATGCIDLPFRGAGRSPAGQRAGGGSPRGVPGCPRRIAGWEGEPAKPGVGRRPLGRRGTPL